MVMFTRALVCAISLLLAFSVKAQQAPLSTFGKRL